MSQQPQEDIGDRDDDEYRARSIGTVRFSDKAGSFDEPESASFRLSADRNSFRVRADSLAFPGYWAEARLSVKAFDNVTRAVTLRVQSSGGRLTDTAKVVAGLTDDQSAVFFKEDEQYMPDSGCQSFVEIPPEIQLILLAIAIRLFD